MSDTTVSLVLGSGGARGLAHIGVIHWLEENGYRIRSIAGCSMGALVGGVYAAGRLDDYESWVRAITKADIFALLDLSWQKSGLVKGDRIIATLKELVGDRLIEDMDIPFTAVATDVQREREVWLSSGSLFDAIRASISMPLFFTPFKLKGAQLIDGSVLNPVPIAPTFADDTDMTIAVNLGGPPEETVAGAARKVPAPADDANGVHAKLTRFIADLRRKTTGAATGDWGAYEIATQAFDAMQGALARQKLAAYPPDRVIEIARNTCGVFEFDRADELIDIGYRKAARVLSSDIEARR